jgi:ArsR family transcriptional regulator
MLGLLGLSLGPDLTLPAVTVGVGRAAPGFWVTMTLFTQLDRFAMVKKAKPLVDESDLESEEVFEKAAEVFRVMSAPMRLRIISALCNGEKNVGELLAEIQTTQPNMSQHLSTLYQAGVLGKRRDGVQIYYRIVNDKVVSLCRAVCVQIASESPTSV